MTLKINLDPIADRMWWDNIGRDAGRDYIVAALDKVDSNDRLVQQEGVAEVYTWLMTSVWGLGCKTFGDDVDRVTLFKQILRQCPNAIKLTRLGRGVTLNLAGHDVDFKGIVGVSTFLPVRNDWANEYIRGEHSFYDFNPKLLSKADGDGFYQRDTTTIFANAMINMVVVDKCLTEPPPHDHDHYTYKVQGLKDVDFLTINRGFYKHLGEFTGPLGIAKNKEFIYRLHDGKKQTGAIPRILTPQTGKGMFDRTLPRLGFEDFGKNLDRENLFICDLNVLKPSRQHLWVASRIGS